MKMIPNHTQSGRHPDATAAGRRKGALVRRLIFATLGVFTVLAMQLSVQAQDRQIWAQFVRLTVPFGQSGTVTNVIRGVTTNTTTPITLSVGAPLPTGVTSATLSTTTPILFPSGSAVLTVNYDGTVPMSGTNEIAILASGDYTYSLPIPIHSATFWTGSTNSPDWSSTANWSGGALPTASDDVVFPNSGANDNGTNAVATNVIVSTSRDVAGLRFSHGWGTNDQSYGFEILPGATLSVTGPVGFEFLQDTVDLPGDMEAHFMGGGNLVVSNESANVALLKESGSGTGDNSTLDLGGLNTFVADVNRVGLGDFSLYPYYTNNGYSGRGGTSTNSRPSRFLPQVTLARTNFIRTTYVDTNNYNDPEVRNYPFSLSRSESQGLGSGSECSLLFGETNVIFADAVEFGGSAAKAASDDRIMFNTDTNVIPTNVVPVIYFRGADGTSRMSVFTVADATGPGGSGTGTKATVNLNGGYVDALVDRLYLGRDRQECQDNDTAQAVLSIAHGIFDVNTAVISSQELGNNPIPVNEQGSDPRGPVFGTLNVSTSAVFRVNGTLYLGYTTADPGDIRVAEAGNGQLNISDGGLVMASNIDVGGVTKVSIDNDISITGGGELVVTNQIGETNKWLNTLTMSDSTLALHVDGNRSTPYVYATNVVTSGTGNTIRLASLVNVSTFPTELPLIAYGVASPNFGVVMPAGYYGYIVNDTANKMIDVVILNTPPIERVWNGSPGITWDTSSPNWMGGAVFVNGDAAQFDDTAANPNVSVSGTVFVGGAGVLVTNNSLAYAFAGAGTIGGTAPMDKWGTASLTMNATSELPLNIHEGSVSGSGALGATSVATNTSLAFSGTINRLTSAGTAVLSPGAAVLNTVTLNGGTLLDSGAISNNFLVHSNASMTVTSGGIVTFPVPSNSQVDQGSSLVLDGTLQSGLALGPAGTYRLDISGTLTGSGRIQAGTPDLNATPPTEVSRLNIASGGVFSPGDTPGQIVTFTNQGRFDFVTGSKIIMDVNMDSPNGSNPFGSALNGSANAKQSDVLFLDRWSTMLGTIEITNIGTQPFTNGTVFKLFAKKYDQYGPTFGNVPLNDGQLPVIEPPSPGLGLVWNLSLFRTNGVITIGSTATNSPQLDATIDAGGTNITFVWPTNHIGWELQTQVNPLSIGLSNNWSVVPGSTDTNEITITNWMGKTNLEIRVYRLHHPRYYLNP